MQKLKTNFLYNSFYQVLLIITPLISAPYISRVLGPANTGIYSYTYSIVQYFVLLTMLGLKNYGNRTVAYNRNDKEQLSKTFWEIYSLQLITSFVMILFYLSFVFLIADEYQVIFSIQSFYLLAALLDISWFFFGVEEFKIPTIRSSLVRIITLILIFVLVKERSDLALYCFIMALGMFIGNVTFWPFLPRFVDFYRPQIKAVFRHLKPNLMLFVPVLAVSVYNLLDIVMLGSFSTMTETGFFQNAEKIVNIPFGLITAVGTVMLPRMSHLASTGDFAKSQKYIGFSLQVVMILSSALCFGIASVGLSFAPIFFGADFAKTGQLLLLIAPIILFKAWANVLRTQYLIPRNRDREYILSVVLGALVNVAANLLLIPLLASIGAVISTVIAEAVVCLYQTYILRKELPMITYFRRSLPYLLLGVAMFMLVSFLGHVLDNSVRSLTIQIFVGAVFYLSLSFVYIYKFDRNVLMILKKI